MLGTFDEITLIAQLADSPVGTTYRGLDKHRGKALRVKSGHSAAELRASADDLRAVDLPGVVAIEDVRLSSAGSAHLVQPEPAAAPLASVLNRYEENWRQIAHLIRECALTLGELHERGITHGDISEHSILINDDGVPVLADVGLGLAHHPVDPHDAQKKERKFVLDKRADMFALGCVLYRLLASEAASDIAPAKLSDPASPHDDIAPIDRVAPEAPTELRAICSQLLSSDPVHRYLEAAPLVRDLEGYLHGKRKKPWVRISVVVIGALMVLLFGLWGTVGGGPARIIDAQITYHRADTPSENVATMVASTEALTTDDRFGVRVQLAKAARVAVYYRQPSGDVQRLTELPQNQTTAALHVLPADADGKGLWPTGSQGGTCMVLIVSVVNEPPPLAMIEGILATAGQPPRSFVPLTWSGLYLPRKMPEQQSALADTKESRWRSLDDYAAYLRRQLNDQISDLVVAQLYVVGL